MKLRCAALAAAAATSSAQFHEGRELAAAAHTDDHASAECHDSHYPCAALSHSCEESCAHHTYTFHYCEEACHICEDHGCVDRWLEEDDAGPHGDREYYYVDSICALFLMAATFIFEHIMHALHKRAHHLPPLQKQSSQIHDKIAGLLHKRALANNYEALFPKRETRAQRQKRRHEAELKHIEHGIGKRRNYVMDLFQRMESELAVLGFISFALFVAHKFEASHAVARRTKDSKWFPQTHHQLDHVVHVAHVALFLGMVLYFSIQYLAARLAVYANQRFLMHASTLATQRAGGSVEETRELRWYATLRDRFITVAKSGVPSVENDFPFQLYLRLYQDDVMYEMVNPKDSTWLCAMVLHAAEALVCRFVANSYIIGYVEAGLSTLIIAVAVFTLYTLATPTTKDWKVSVNGEYFIVNALQSLVLCNSYRFARAMLHNSIAWYNVYVVFTIILVCPLLVVFGNVLLRVPPFIDKADWEVIEAVAAFKARVAGDAPPSEINFMKADSRASMTKVAPTEE